MFDPLYTLIVNTLRANEKIIFDGQYDVEGGETFSVPFVAKSPAPDNKADVELSEVFAQFPDGFAVQRIANLEHTKVRKPVGLSTRFTEEYQGTFLLTVTKANWQKGDDGVSGQEGRYVDDEENVVEDENDLGLADIIARYNKLPELKKKQFTASARLLLKGLAL
ncbi:hypothetical protein MPK71_gp167 [Erwinia phage pEa_SNUABM_1]|uniref:Uncharacterized protein n=1 Tax=Erwinia phage pEa_SNUABM_1 TaxID=2869543 RepID=A0AAE7XLF4_9CAUD|nr:hypothetical protein MPK71_gp167 [Erwinia phage pEa_SNUABM_1]QZE57376.1 hypothetical protein pEaSNUABM1_00167 [Erwinia phage pEa_SNUABM_1]